MIPTTYIQDQLFRYAELHSNGITEHLKTIERMTHGKCLAPQMLSGSNQGRLLSFISKMKQAKLALEIGTFTGYSAICIAEGLSDHGILHTIEISEQYNEFYHFIHDKIDIAGKIKFHIGDALEIIPSIEGKFDIVFIDAAKKEYLNYLKIIEDRMNSGGILISDNVLWSGKVLDEIKDSDTEILHQYNQYLKESDKWDVMILPIRDGISMAIRK